MKHVLFVDLYRCIEQLYRLRTVAFKKCLSDLTAVAKGLRVEVLLGVGSDLW